MTRQREIAKKDIDALLAFLPKFTEPGKKLVSTAGGGYDAKTHTLNMPLYEYHPDVIEFFRLASAECWTDYNYVPEVAGQILRDPRRIKLASMDELKTILTFCVRGERFCDGHWGTVLKEGSLIYFLGRLKQLHKEIS